MRCPSCGGSKRFDSEIAYRARCAELHTLGRRLRLMGALLIAIGASSAVAIFGLLVALSVGLLNEEVALALAMTVPFWPVVGPALGVLSWATIRGGTKRFHLGNRAWHFQ